MNPFLRLSLIGLLLLFAACAKKKTLTISGSTTLGEKLMPHLMTEFFRSQAIKLETIEKINDTLTQVIGSRNDVIFTLNIHSNSSGKGLLELEQGKTGIAMISGIFKHHGYDTLRLASDSIVLIAHRQNPLVNPLKIDQVKAIFSGNINRWDELQLSYPYPIHLHIRNISNSGTSNTFQSLVLNDSAYSPQAKQHNSNSDLLEDIKRDYYGIGYISSTELTNSEDFKRITIEGEAIIRPLFLCFKKDKQTDLERAFLEFCQTEKVKRILADYNFKL
jgi:ABC-type phosphate transport system substrate-binding protein